MTKIKSLADLKKMKSDLQSQISLRERSDKPEGRILIKVSMSTCGIASGAKEVMEFMIDELERQSIDAIITQTGCMGYCHAEPTLEITIPEREPVVYGHVDISKAEDIINRYIKSGEMLDGILPVNYEQINK